MEQFIKSLKNLDQEPSFKVEQDGYQIGISFTLRLLRESSHKTSITIVIYTH